MVGSNYDSRGYSTAVRWQLIPPNLSPSFDTPPANQAGVEGGIVAFQAAATDPEGATVSYDWDFGDGSIHGSGDAPSHTYADNGIYPVTVTVSDGTNSVSASSTSTISNAAPSATFQVPGVDIETGLTFAIAFTAPSDPSTVDEAAGFTYAFDCEGDGSFAATGTTPNLICTSGAPGSYSVAGQLTDKDGATTSYTGTITVVAVPNLPPAVTLAPSFSGDEGSSLTFSAVASDPERQPITYSWDFGDGTGADTHVIASHGFNDNRLYAVTLTVSDGVNATVASSTVTIANVAPSATLQVPGVSITAGTPFAIALTGATDPSSVGMAAGFTYAFDCENDGTFTAPSATPNTLCTINASGPATVAARILDKDGGTDSYTGMVTIVPAINLPPAVTIGGPYAATEGSATTLGASGTDPEGQPLTYSWSFGDGTPAGAGPAPSHAFPDNGTFTVTVTVSDGVNASSASTTAIITNVAPTGVISAPAGAGAPQGAVTLTLGSVVDPSPVDAAALQYRFNCGAGYGAAVSTPTITCAIPKVGSVTLRIIVRDKDGAQNAYAKVVSITNVAPTVTLLSSSAVTVPRGTSVSFSASFTDPGTSDNPWPARVNWGVGAVQNLGNKTRGVPFSASKKYNTVGVYTATVEVADKFGAMSSRSFNGDRAIGVDPRH